jgi:hypothetical protein
MSEEHWGIYRMFLSFSILEGDGYQIKKQTKRERVPSELSFSLKIDFSPPQCNENLRSMEVQSWRGGVKKHRTSK